MTSAKTNEDASGAKGPCLSLDFEKLITSMKQGFSLHEIVCDHVGRPCDYVFLYVNSAFENLTGQKADEIVGRSVKTVFPGIEPFWIETYGKVAFTGEPISFEHYTESLNAWFEVTAYSPQKGYFACIFSEITERKRSEEELKLFKTIIESSSEAIAVGKSDGRIIYTNAAHQKLFGIPRSRAVNSNFVESLPIESAEIVRNEIMPTLMKGDGWQGEFDAIGSEDSLFRLWMRADTVRDKDGNIIHVFGLMHDVSETRLMQAAKRSAEERLQTFMSNVDDAVYFLSLDGNINCYNPACFNFSGYTNEEFSADPKLWQKIMDADDLKTILSTIEKRPVNFVLRDIEFRSMHKNGSWRWINTRITPAFSDKGELIGYNCIGRDITRSKRSETILRMSSKISSIFLVSEPERIFHDVLGFLLDSFRSQIGFIAYFENPDTPVFLSTVPNDIFEVCKINGKIWSGFNLCAQSISEKKILFKNGELEFPAGHIRVENAISVPIIFKNSTIALVVIANSSADFGREDRNILKALSSHLAPVIESHMKTVQKERERKFFAEEKERLELQIRQTQKIEAVGQLAGGVAHDLNNMLSPILGYSELLICDFPDNPEIQNGVSEIKKAAERAKDLVKDLLAFSRKQVLELMTEDLNYIISRMERMLRHVIMENIRVDFTLSDYPINIMVDRGQVEQILLNLALNAQDAMPSGGVLSVSTAMVFLDKKVFDAEGKILKSGNYALLEIRDSGCGMRPEVLDHIFEPFFTTKNVGRGTGLGLASVYGIVNQHNGMIEVNSEAGRGSSFRIFLPVSEGFQGRASSVNDTMDSVCGTEVVVLVEDNEMVRFFVEHVLRRHGFNVMVADSSEKGLDLVESYPSDIHLVLTDVVMPEMSGKEFYEQARKMKPGLRVIYMTGYGEDVLASQGLIGKEDRIITKPFTIAELVSSVRNTLDN